MICCVPRTVLADADDESAEFAIDVRETLLQDSFDLPNEEAFIVSAMTAQLCLELARGSSSSWRCHGFSSLWYLYQTAHGKKSIFHLAMNGNLIKLANRTFKK